MLERDQPVRLITGATMCPLQALAQIGRHGNRSELVRKGLRHQLPPDAVPHTPAAPAAPALRNAKRGIARQAHPVQVLSTLLPRIRSSHTRRGTRICELRIREDTRNL